MDAIDEEVAKGADHEDCVRRLKRTFAHSIVYRDWPPTTCLPHALGLDTDERYHNIALFSAGLATSNDKLWANGDFARWLLDLGHLGEFIDPGDADSCVALYFNDEGTWTHAAIQFSDGRLQSKWGWQPLYEHGLWEVPATYGNKVRYFNHLPIERPYELFHEFLMAAKGLSESDIRKIVGRNAGFSSVFR